MSDIWSYFAGQSITAINHGQYGYQLHLSNGVALLVSCRPTGTEMDSSIQLSILSASIPSTDLTFSRDRNPFGDVPNEVIQAHAESDLRLAHFDTWPAKTEPKPFKTARPTDTASFGDFTCLVGDNIDSLEVVDGGVGITFSSQKYMISWTSNVGYVDFIGLYENDELIAYSSGAAGGAAKAVSTN